MSSGTENTAVDGSKRAKLDKTKNYLGEELECIVTKFRGIATCRAEYLDGSVRYCLERLLKGRTEKPTSEYFDIARLSL